MQAGHGAVRHGGAPLWLHAAICPIHPEPPERLAAEAHLGGGRRNEIEVEGHPWHQVTDLAGSRAEDPRHLVSRRDDGASVNEFGDGVQGRRPPSNNSIGVRARSRSVPRAGFTEPPCLTMQTRSCTGACWFGFPTSAVNQQGPTVGDGVWIALESCDPSRPIWLGQRITD